MVQVPAPDFSLKDTLECGQAFRWGVHDGAYYGFIGPCAVRVMQDDDALLVETADSRLTPEAITRYFALDVELARILDSIDADALIHEAIARFRGLRILRQDPWECLASFILSSYNNIKRIEGMIERLCVAFGAPAAFNGFRGCSFPAPESIARASERRLRELGLGFRAPYLKATARLIADGKLPLETLQRTDYQVARSSLLSCEGVGDKVADCVALFGLAKYQAFPVDVWIARAMRYYFRNTRMTPGRIHDFAWRHFGRFAGYAQQYLYHYVRNGRLAVSNQQPAISQSKADC
jgi:N-glycosylase/DNA lyase